MITSRELPQPYVVLEIRVAMINQLIQLLNLDDVKHRPPRGDKLVLEHRSQGLLKSSFTTAAQYLRYMIDIGEDAYQTVRTLTEPLDPNNAANSIAKYLATKIDGLTDNKEQAQKLFNDVLVIEEYHSLLRQLHSDDLHETKRLNLEGKMQELSEKINLSSMLTSVQLDAVEQEVHLDRLLSERLKDTALTIEQQRQKSLQSSKDAVRNRLEELRKQDAGRDSAPKKARDPRVGFFSGSLTDDVAENFKEKRSEKADKFSKGGTVRGAHDVPPTGVKYISKEQDDALNANEQDEIEKAKKQSKTTEPTAPSIKKR